MAKYKIVFRSGEESDLEKRPRWELGCPLQVLAVQISRNVETSETYLQIKVRNIAARTVDSIFGFAAITYRDGTEERISLEYLDQEIEHSNTKALNAISIPRRDVTEASVTLSQIDGDGINWLSSSKPTTVPEADTLNLDETAAYERRFRLMDTGFDPDQLSKRVVDKENWWVCSCGQLNLDRAECCECGISKQYLLDLQDERSLEEAGAKRKDAKYRNALELAGNATTPRPLLQAIDLLESISPWKDSEEKIAGYKSLLEAILSKRKAKARKTAVALISAIAAIAAIASLSVFVIAPWAESHQITTNAQSPSKAASPDLSLLESFDRASKGETFKIIKSTEENSYYEDSYSDACNARFSENENKVTFFYSHKVTRQGSSTDASFTTNVTFQYEASETKSGDVMLELRNPTFTEESPAPPTASEGDNYLVVKISKGEIERITGSLPAIGIQDIESFGNVEESVDSRGDIVSELKQRYNEMQE